MVDQFRCLPCAWAEHRYQMLSEAAPTLLAIRCCHTSDTCEIPARPHPDPDLFAPLLAHPCRIPACRNGGSSLLRSSDKSSFYYLTSGNPLPCDQSRDICSRPWRNVFAIQMSSFKNLSMRPINNRSRSLPS